MAKSDFFILSVITLNFFLLFFGLSRQMIYRENQFICMGYLRHWGSAITMYRHQTDSKFSPKETLEKIFSLMDNPVPVHCPSVSRQDVHAYGINRNAFERNLFISNEGWLVLDAKTRETPWLEENEGPMEAEKRHLGGFNVLRKNGAVSHCKNWE